MRFAEIRHTIVTQLSQKNLDFWGDTP